MKIETGQKAVALITGGATRIGAEITRALAAAGIATIIHYRESEGEAASLAERINNSGGSAKTVRADLASRSDRQALIGKAAEAFGPLSILINNASIYEPDSVETLDEELWDRHFAVHAKAPLFLARDFAAQLPQGSTGNIVNLLDSRMLNLSPAYTSYTLSKSVLWAATQTMAQELAPHIRVNAVGPGPTLPETDRDITSFQKRVASLPLGHSASPADVADAVLYFIKARAVTGQMLALDGGQFLEWPERTKPTPRRT